MTIRPTEPAERPPEQETGAPNNPTHLPVEPEFGDPLPPAEAEEPGVHQPPH